MSSLAASSSIRHSRPNVPSTKPGARNAFIGGVFSFAPYMTVRTLSHAYSICIGPSVIAVQPDQPTAFVNSPARATIVPSLVAPTVSFWMVALRFPAAVFSSRRVSPQRTGRPVRRASSAATNVYSPGSFFEPKPPPMYSQTTRTRSAGMPSSRATDSRTPQRYCVEM